MKIKLILIFFSMIALCSCASFAKSERACKISTKGNPSPLEKIGAYFSGNIFQIGDCAVSERLRIELGLFASYRKNSIRTELGRDPTEIKEDMLTLFELFGCKPHNQSLYLDFTKKHLAHIFQEKNDLSGREIMLSVREKIKNDEAMQGMCFH